MKILVLNGSPRKVVCYSFCEALKDMSKEFSHSVEVVHLCDYSFGYCLGCKSCEKSGECVQADEFNRSIEPKLREADLVVFATPDYFAMPSAAMKNFMDRSYSSFRAVSSGNKEFAVFISAESDYYGCMSVYERVKEYAEMMGMSEHSEPYFQMNTKATFEVDDRLKDYITELLMKKIYVGIDPVDTDEALAEIDA